MLAEINKFNDNVNFCKDYCPFLSLKGQFPDMYNFCLLRNKVLISDMFVTVAVC